MTMINAYSVGIGLNAKGLIDGGMLARKELTSLTRTMHSLTAPSERMANQLNLVEKALKAEKDAMRGNEPLALALTQAHQRLTEKINAESAALERNAQAQRKAQQAMQASSATAQMQAREFAKIQRAPMMGGGSGGGGVGGVTMLGVASRFLPQLAVGMIAKNAISDSFALERNQVKYSTLLGSEGAGLGLSKGISKLAADTPLRLSGAQDAASTLLQFGVAGEKVLPTLRMLGDVTGADAQRFQSMTLAYSQMSAAGRLTGQDLLQMINSGFNPLQERARRTGQSMMELRQLMEEGGYSAEMAAEDFRKVTEEGGRMHGMMDRMADTAFGRTEKFMSQLEEASQQLGKGLSPAITGLAPALDLIGAAAKASGSPSRLCFRQWAFTSSKVGGLNFFFVDTFFRFLFVSFTFCRPLRTGFLVATDGVLVATDGVALDNSNRTASAADGVRTLDQLIWMSLEVP